MIARLWLDVDRVLRGQPDRWITAALIVVGVVAIVAALVAPRPLKATVLAWMVAP